MARKITKRIMRKRRGGKRMGKRSSNAVTGGPNTCKITETYNLGNVLLNTPEEYFFEGIPANSRAAAVAPNFGLYRVAKVTFTYKPYFDTYLPSVAQAGGPAVGNQPVSLPTLYWKMNRYGDAPIAFDANFLRQQGAKPIRLDDKIVTLGYKPSILLADAGAVAAGLNGGSGQVKMTPWLSTDNQPGNNAFALSTTVHYGHLLFVEGNVANVGQPMPGICEVEAQVVWEFKNPRATAGLQGNQVRPRRIGLEQTTTL